MGSNSLEEHALIVMSASAPPKSMAEDLPEYSSSMPSCPEPFPTPNTSGPHSDLAPGPMQTWSCLHFCTWQEGAPQASQGDAEKRCFGTWQDERRGAGMPFRDGGEAGTRDLTEDDGRNRILCDKVQRNPV